MGETEVTLDKGPLKEYSYINDPENYHLPRWEKSEYLRIPTNRQNLVLMDKTVVVIMEVVVVITEAIVVIMEAVVIQIVITIGD